MRRGFRHPRSRKITRRGVDRSPADLEGPVPSSPASHRKKGLEPQRDVEAAAYRSAASRTSTTSH
jgi:hypothetical protein